MLRLLPALRTSSLLLTGLLAASASASPVASAPADSPEACGPPTAAMTMPSPCPTCRGELVVKTTNDKWDITFSSLTSTASGFETDTFVVTATLADESTVAIPLADISGTQVGDRTEYFWSLDEEDDPVYATITVEHDTLGTLIQELDIDEV